MKGQIHDLETPHMNELQKNNIKTDKFNNFQKIQTPKSSYPLTDLDMALPKLDKPEAIEAKKPPPPPEVAAAAATCLGSFGAMAMKSTKDEISIEKK